MSELRPTVLLVDDAPENLRILAEMLRSWGFAARAVTSAPRALELLQKQAVDLIVLDVNMPEMSGYELCTLLKANPVTAGVPVIFLSAEHDTSHKVEAFQRGGVDYITKPFQREEVRARVEMQLRLQAEHRRSRALQDEIVRQERLASLGRLVAGVAHEISTPLGVAVTAGSLIGEAVDALVRQIESPRPMKSELLKTLAATREGLAILTTNLGRASELMGQFKLVAVDQSSNVMRRVNVGEYVEEVLGSLQPLLRRRKVQVAIECAAPVQTVTVPGALSQVVTNLLQNALTHAFGPEEAGTVTFSVEREDEFTVLACRDNGRGMEQAVANRIFEPFFTTRIGSGGSGLGLFLVNNLVTEALKGDIAVFSMPGQGTTFRVRFRDLAATSTTLDGTRPPSGEVERSGTR